MDIKVLFCFYPLYVKWNHGISIISAMCKVNGIDTKLYLLKEPNKFREYLKNNHFNCIGFSCVTYKDYELSLPFMAIARDMGITTMLGGVYPRLLTRLEAPVDYICRGEGENLPQFILTGDPTVFKDINISPNLNALPLPDYELFKDIPYNRVIPLTDGKKGLPYSSSRGCPYQCSFCQVSHQPDIVRVRTKVGDDLSFLMAKYNPELIHFVDELIPYYDEKWRDSWGVLRHPFIAYIRADIPEKWLVWLKDHGLVGCFFGVESGNEQYRNKILRKNLTDRKILKTVAMLQEMGIPYMASYMRGAPWETWEIQAQTLAMSKELGGYPVFYQYEEIARS